MLSYENPARGFSRDNIRSSCHFFSASALLSSRAFALFQSRRKNPSGGFEMKPNTGEADYLRRFSLAIRER